MANPYEENTQLSDSNVVENTIKDAEEVTSRYYQGDTSGYDYNPSVNTSTEVETPTTTTTTPTPTTSTEVTPSIETPTSVEEEKPLMGDYFPSRKAAWNLPDGPEKLKALDDWAKKYHGTSWNEYVAVEKSKNWKQRLFDPISNEANFQETIGGKQNADVRNPLNWANYPSAMGYGLMDFAADTANMVLPDKYHIEKAPKFESQALQAWREISGLVIPFLYIRKGITAGGTKLHGSGAAAKNLPLLHRLGNNPVFARFAMFGADTYSGILADQINTVNKANDTLATSWKRGNWLGSRWIPESWTSDKLSPDQKHAANIREGGRLGFFGSILEGMVKIGRASRGTSKVTQYLAEVPSNQKVLNELVTDPLDSVKYSDDPIEDALLRSEARQVRDENLLSKFFINKNQPIEDYTVGIHKFESESATGIIHKSTDGIIGAAKDQAQIANNIETTFGRLGNILTDAYRKFSLEPDAILERSLLKTLRDDLIKGGRYKVKLPNGGTLSSKLIDQEGRILAEIISDPTLSRGDLTKILSQFQSTVKGIKRLNPVGYKALEKAKINLLNSWGDVNTHKARAYLLTSEAGQISDLSRISRELVDENALRRVNDQILDRLKLFEIETKISDFEWASKNRVFNELKNLAKRGNTDDVLKRLKDFDSAYTNRIGNIITESDNFIETLRSLQAYQPEFTKSLALAYEFSDGNVKTVKDLNKIISNMFGTASKAVVDWKDPNIPSMLIRGYWTNLFNSMLSGLGTIGRAAFGNIGGFIERPLSIAVGAMKAGDKLELQRMAHQYLGFVDTFQKGFGHLGRTFRKASENSVELSHLVRDDIAIRDIQQLRLAEEFAEASANKGEFGPTAILNWAKELQALGRDPRLRFGPNSLTSLDGFTQATLKVAEDKGKVFDMLLEQFPDGNWTKTQWEEAYDAVSKSGFDSQGRITDTAVDYARREIALNLDTTGVSKFNEILGRVPALRSIFFFPKTSLNVGSLIGKFAPRLDLRAVPGVRKSFTLPFLGDYVELLGDYGTRSIDDFTVKEIEQILTKRGMDMSGDYMSKFARLRYQVEGRAAIGNLAVMGAGLLAMQDRITGDGHWDPAVQKNRYSLGWKKRTYQGLDGKWHSYDFLGPLADWVALVVNGFDNFDQMSTTSLEKHEKKLALLLAGSVTQPSGLSNMEVLFDLLSGQGAPTARWKAQMMNNTFPLGGFRNEIGKLLNPTLKVVKNDDVGELIRNRNSWLDPFDPTGGLGPRYDWITGRPIVTAEGGLFTRMRNHMTPFKIYPKRSPEADFLINIEYDGQPHFYLSSKNVPYTSKEISELEHLIGKDGIFNAELKEIMKYANNMKHTFPDGTVKKGYIEILQHMRRLGIASTEYPFLTDLEGVKYDIDRALVRAKENAETELSTRDRVIHEHDKNRESGVLQQQGDINEIIRLNSANP